MINEVNTLESYKKDRKYLEEILELYNRDIFSDYIIGIHLKPESYLFENDILEVTKRVANEIEHIKLTYLNDDQVVFYIRPFSNFFNYRLQDILSYVAGKVNSYLDGIFYYGHIYGFKNISSAYKLIDVLNTDINRNNKMDWNVGMSQVYQLDAITGNVDRDELTISSMTGEYFEPDNGILIDKNNEIIKPSFKYSEMKKIMEENLKVAE